MIIEQFLVPEMANNRDVRHIEDTLRKLPGVQQVQCNIAQQSVRVAHDEQTNMAHLIDTIKRAGYQRVSVLV
jgi:copper chaperone CopZ